MVAVFETEIDNGGKFFREELEENNYLIISYAFGYTILCSCSAHSQGDPKYTLCVPSRQGMQTLFVYLDVPLPS